LLSESVGKRSASRLDRWPAALRAERMIWIRERSASSYVFRWLTANARIHAASGVTLRARANTADTVTGETFISRAVARLLMPPPTSA
jgi:hypothetical protein